MKKILISAALVVVSLVFVFSKNTDNSAGQFAVSTTSAVVPVVPVSPNPTPSAQATSPQPTKTSVVKVQTVTKTQSAPPPPKQTTPTSLYNDGTYTGAVADAYYGNVQVEVTVSGGVISNVNFLQYPSDRSTSRYINGQATPILAQEAIKAQSASVDVVSGATDTSHAFEQSLSSALSQARA